MREADLWRQLPELHGIDGLFALPRHLRFVTAECGEAGAFYRPAQAEVVLCYETLRDLYAQGQAHQQALGLGDGHPLRYLRANVRFIVLHETGHALVDLLDLPVTGRQEDAVDQLAAILMLRFGGLDESPGEVIADLRLAANWMLSRSTGAYDLDAYADPHALGEQRFFNLQCLIYGTDPDDFAGMVEAGDLTAARAAGGGAVGVAEGVGQGARGDLPGQAPLVLAPAAIALLAAVADDGVPVAVGLFLVVGGDLERERLALRERRAAVEAQAWDAEHGELDGEHVALLATGEIPGRAVDLADRAVRESGGVERRGAEGVVVEPQADRVLRDHAGVP